MFLYLSCCWITLSLAKSGHLQAVQTESSVVNDSNWANFFSTWFLTIPAWSLYWLSIHVHHKISFFSFLWNACDLAWHHFRKVEFRTIKFIRCALLWKKNQERPSLKPLPESSVGWALKSGVRWNWGPFLSTNVVSRSFWSVPRLKGWPLLPAFQIMEQTLWNRSFSFCQPQRVGCYSWLPSKDFHVSSISSFLGENCFWCSFLS